MLNDLPPLGINQETWQQAIANPARIISIEHDGHILWLKKAAPARGVIRYWTLNALASWLHAPFLKAVPQPGGVTALSTEGARLKALAIAGIHVPQIAWSTSNMLLLTDIGTNISRQFSACRSDQEKSIQLLQQVFSALNQLHINGQYLSQGFARNIMLDDAIVGFIDFEDDPLQVMSLQQAQTRDLVLLIFSVTRYFMDKQTAFHKIVNQQINNLPHASQQQIRQLARKLQWVKKLPAKKYLGSDYKRLVSALDALS